MSGFTKGFIVLAEPISGITETIGKCGACEHHHPVGPLDGVGINFPGPCQCGCQNYVMVMCSYTIPSLASNGKQRRIPRRKTRVGVALRYDVEIRPSPIHGKGAFATRDIPRGTVLKVPSGTLFNWSHRPNTAIVKESLRLVSVVDGYYVGMDFRTYKAVKKGDELLLGGRGRLNLLDRCRCGHCLGKKQ